MHELAEDEMWIVKRKGMKNGCRSGWIEYQIENEDQVASGRQDVDNKTLEEDND